MDTLALIEAVREDNEAVSYDPIMRTCSFFSFDDEGIIVHMSQEIESMSPYDWSLFILQWAETKGWNDPNRNQSEWTALAHTEISEAYEEYRNGHSPQEIYFNTDGSNPDKPEGMAIEYADLLIRIFHWFASVGVNPNEVIAEKMRYNFTRPYRHGGKVT